MWSEIQEINISYKLQDMTMASIMQLWSEWEIQFMVLLSFTLQVFLFITGGVRRHHTNMLLTLSIWLAYLGADLVALYALGLLSRYPTSDNNYSLTFFWAPFLLVHLGGQDTITAFAIEDNNLWLRHLLNLSVQVGLAMYVLWNSSGQSEFQQLVQPALFLFVAGVIKYGERTWALKRGNQNGLWSSSVDNENKKELPIEEDRYPGLLCYALNTAPFIRGFQMGSKARRKLYDDFARYKGNAESKLKVLEMELAMMYDVLYTKAMVTQTWPGAILRFVAQVSMMVAFVLFHASNKEMCSTADVGLTYALLIGGLFMEVCSFFMVLLSPWTWASMKARNCNHLAYLSWSLFKTIRPEKRRWWSSSIGQYNFIQSLAHDRSTCFAVITAKIMNAIGLENIWRIIRHTKEVKAKIEITGCIVEWSEQTLLKKVPNLGKALKDVLHGPFENAIIQLHLFTELHIREGGDQQPRTSDELHLSDICEKISNYMLYLLVFYPSMLPVSGSAQDTLELFSKKITSTREDDIRYEVRYGESLFVHVRSLFVDAGAARSFRDSLEEIKEMWIRLLVYAACRSQPEMHAQLLGKGGELLTFIWFLIGAHHAYGGIARQFDLISPSSASKMFVEGRWAPVQGYREYLFDFQSSESPLCQICNKVGHMALECYNRFDHSYQANNPGMVAEPSFALPDTIDSTGIRTLVRPTTSPASWIP